MYLFKNNSYIKRLAHANSAVYHVLFIEICLEIREVLLKLNLVLPSMYDLRQKLVNQTLIGKLLFYKN